MSDIFIGILSIILSAAAIAVAYHIHHLQNKTNFIEKSHDIRANILSTARQIGSYTDMNSVPQNVLSPFIENAEKLISFIDCISWDEYCKRRTDDCSSLISKMKSAISNNNMEAFRRLSNSFEGIKS